MNVSSVAQTFVHTTQNGESNLQSDIKCGFVWALVRLFQPLYFKNKVKSVPFDVEKMADVTQEWRGQTKARTQVSLHLRLHDLCYPIF